jgi:hypothetical protein
MFLWQLPPSSQLERKVMNKHQSRFWHKFRIRESQRKSPGPSPGPKIPRTSYPYNPQDFVQLQPGWRMKHRRKALFGWIQSVEAKGQREVTVLWDDGTQSTYTEVDQKTRQELDVTWSRIRGKQFKKTSPEGLLQTESTAHSETELCPGKSQVEE